MIMRGTDILKLVSHKKNGKLQFTYFNNKKLKKNREHNNIVMDLLSVLDNTEYTIHCGERVNNITILTIEHDAIEYILKQLEI